LGCCISDCRFYFGVAICYLLACHAGASAAAYANQKREEENENFMGGKMEIKKPDPIMPIYAEIFTNAMPVPVPQMEWNKE
jgi:hypothetical protein